MVMSGKLLFLIGQTKIKDVHFVKKVTVKVRIIKSDIEMYISEKDVLRIFYHTHIGKSKYKKSKQHN